MPNSLFETAPETALSHQAFLERASDSREPGAGDVGLGAFLTLRMVDQFRADAKPNREALNYQVRATIDLLNGLTSDSAEVKHLRQIARVGEQVLKRREPRFLWSPLLAYAFWLERELRLPESADVLNTTLDLHEGPESEEQVAAYLQRGRVLRLMSAYDASMASYETGAEIAQRLGDAHSVRKSRVGRSVIHQKTGNLAASEAGLRQVMADAHADEDREAEATASHELAISLELMGRFHEGIAAAFRAFELHEQSEQRLKSLQVVGILMKGIGNFAAAENAFAVVMASDPFPEFRQNTMLELLDLAGLTGDRMAFERWRRELDGQRSALPPDACVDFETKVGQGYAVFGQLERAREAVESAIKRAEQHQLNKYLFRAEELLKQLNVEQVRTPPRRRASAAVAEAHVAEVDEVAEKLQLLRASAA